MQHLNPCNECPFRRKSLSGYLGLNKLNEFVVLANSDYRMPCHTRVDYQDKNWQEIQKISDQCAGRGIFLGNICKLPRDKEVLRLPANRELVFSSMREFIAHHTQFADPSFDDEDDLFWFPVLDTS